MFAEVIHVGGGLVFLILLVFVLWLIFGRRG